MSVLADYTPEQQQLLLRSLEAAGVVISAASLGPKRETVSEGFAAASYIMESRGEYLDNALIQSIQYALEERARSDAKFPDYTAVASAPGAKEHALTTLRQAIALLNAKTSPEEASGFKTWLMNIAVRTTEAGKEGGNFLGLGGVAVNDAERAALQEIADILGVPAPPIP